MFGAQTVPTVVSTGLISGWVLVSTGVTREGIIDVNESFHGFEVIVQVRTLE
jgi:hypothetical protein